ncbi:integral membrane protein [Streptomyces sp. SPB78]|nr:integral membrane protein [Streptomyces sp. SPB78]
MTEVVSAPGSRRAADAATREVSGITRTPRAPRAGWRAVSGPDRPRPPGGQVPNHSASREPRASGLFVTWFRRFRVGTLLVGLALLLGAVLRWTVGAVGMLAVRSRFTDTLTYGVLGLVVFFLALMVQPNPWLVIPFLDEILHFTVD